MMIMINEWDLIMGCHPAARLPAQTVIDGYQPAWLMS